MRPVVKPLLAVALVLAGVTACSDDNPESAEPPETTAANIGDSEPDATATHESDGVLRIGVLLPQTGEGATIGIPGTTAASQAVNEINEAGGVLGELVQLVQVDEGQDPDQARAAVAELLSSDVDAVLGPASSVVALENLDDLVSAGLVTCSPSATSMALDRFPDDGLFFRSVPSDSLAAVAIGGQARRTGVSTASVIYVDDAFGRPLSRAVVENLRGSRNIAVLAEVPIQAGASDYSSAVEQIAKADATGTIIVIANSRDGWNFLTQLADALPRPPKIIVNDALRRPPAQEIVAQLPETFRTAIEGLSPMAIIESGAPPQGAYAPQAYNCVNLIALAAIAAESDDPRAIAAQMQGVANDGSECATFEHCVNELNQGLDINYDGPTTLLQEIGDDGDPSRARFQVFTFNDTGVDVGAGAGNVS